MLWTLFQGHGQKTIWCQCYRLLEDKSSISASFNGLERSNHQYDQLLHGMSVANSFHLHGNKSSVIFVVQWHANGIVQVWRLRDFVQSWRSSWRNAIMLRTSQVVWCKSSFVLFTFPLFRTIFSFIRDL